VIVTFIDIYRARFGLSPICAVLTQHGISIAPSTYYARRSMPVTPAELEDAYLANTLVTLHRENWSVYGVHKLWHVARRQGLELGRDQVARLMGIAGLAGVVRGRHTTRTTRREEGAPTPRPGPHSHTRRGRPASGRSYSAPGGGENPVMPSEP